MLRGGGMPALKDRDDDGDRVGAVQAPPTADSGRGAGSAGPATSPEPLHASSRRAIDNGFDTPNSTVSSHHAHITSPSGRTMQHAPSAPVPPMWRGAPACFNDGRSLAARVDGAPEERVFAQVKVLEKTAPFKLLFCVTAGGGLSASREISVEDLQWIITLEQQVGPPPTSGPLQDDELKANDDMHSWATTRKIPSRKSVILWLLQRMVLVKDGVSQALQLKVGLPSPPHVPPPTAWYTCMHAHLFPTVCLVLCATRRRRKHNPARRPLVPPPRWPAS